MTKSAIIKQEILALLGDKNKHSVQEMKEYLNSRQIGEYTEGQFAGVLNNLQKNNLICKAERGIYSLIEKNDNGLKKCFVAVSYTHLILDFEKKERAKEVAELVAKKAELQEENATFQEINEDLHEQLLQVDDEICSLP